MSQPQLILLLSGKRKSGKDYISEKLSEMLTKENCTIVRISEPIKSHYAKTFDLDLSKLLSDGPYKETYRLDMINWSENERSKNYGCFCKIACENAPVKPIWIVSDIRRKTDLKWFEENYGTITKTIRINTDENIRKDRGWIFTEGVDDMSSECDLDDVHSWDCSFYNNNTNEAQTILESLYSIANKIIN